jgi:hypothetical protein
MSTINLENYADLRDISRQFCGTLQGRAAGHLETVRVLFRPGAVFGPFLAGSHKDAPRDAATSMAQFRSFFAEVAAAKPFSLDASVPEPFETVFGTPALHPYTYSHEVTTRTGPRTVQVTSPLEWVLGFPEYPFPKLRELVLAPKRDADELKAIAIPYAALHFVVMRNPQVLALFEALRFPITSEKLPGFGSFSVLVMRAPAGTVRPPDDVVAQVIKYAGADVVEEVLDYEQWSNLRDPYAELFRPVGESMQF